MPSAYDFENLGELTSDNEIENEMSDSNVENEMLDLSSDFPSMHEYICQPDADDVMDLSTESNVELQFTPANAICLTEKNVDELNEEEFLKKYDLEGMFDEEWHDVSACFSNEGFDDSDLNDSPDDATCLTEKNVDDLNEEEFVKKYDLEGMFDEEWDDVAECFSNEEFDDSEWNDLEVIDECEKDIEPDQGDEETVICPICRHFFESEALLGAHSVFHTQSLERFDEDDASLERCGVVAFDGLARDYRMTSNVNIVDIPIWLRSHIGLIDACLTPLMRVFVVKAMMYARVRFVRVNAETGDVVQEMQAFLPSGQSEHVVDLTDWFESHVCHLSNTLYKFTSHEGSEWQIDGLEFVLLKVSLCENAAGMGVFKIPDALKVKKAVVNVDCERACFKYAVLSVLHYNDVKTNRQRVSKYDSWVNDLKFDGIDVDAVDIRRDIIKFEKMNDLKVNVHVWNKGLKGIRYCSRKNTSSRTVNLLLVVNSDGQQHYCGITNLRRLYTETKNKQILGLPKEIKYICERCIQTFKSEQKYHTHYEWCRRGKARVESMPAKRDFKYEDCAFELSPLRVVYADAECFIEPESKIHQPAAFGMFVKWHEALAERDVFKSWDGSGCVEKFLGELDNMVKEQFTESNLTRQSMTISPQEHQDFYDSKSCPRCNSAYSEQNKKVRDHCHITGRFRSALCSKCNFRLCLKRNTLPVIFHNLKNYDSHLIIKHGIDKFKDWQLSVIPQTSEKFMNIHAKVPVGKTKTGKTIFFNLMFLDSFQFMSSSLASLAQNLESLPITEKMKENFPSINTETIRRKGVFPYSYFSSLETLHELSLPSRFAFKNDLTGEECSEEDYSHAQRAWREFKCKDFRDYMLRYLELDIRILTDVFEEFRRMSLQQDGLEPVHFVSLPGLSFKSAFKMTGETIHLLQDPYIYSLFERGIRGGLTFVNTHYAKEELVRINDKDCKRILMYIDQNNLYGAAMSEYLPHSNFKLLTDDEIGLLFPSENQITALDAEGDQGYFFEVDLEYPSDIHIKTADFPLAPESGVISHDMLSSYMQELHCDLHKTNNPNSTQAPQHKSSRKLLLTQFNKKNYCVHFKILKYYLEKGLHVTQIHNVVSFTQKKFLKPYIDFNSHKRAQAKNSFEKDFYKLKNNSLFGKTMEDVRKHTQYKLVTNETTLQKLVASPLFHDRDIITSDLVGVKMLKGTVTLDKPIYIGQAVLDHSKLQMYQLFYDILPQCPLIHTIKLLGGDTDSFFLSLLVDPGTTPADILSNMSTHVDFSNYPSTHPLFSVNNKAKLGCFKDELAGREIEEMILLKPKMYSIKIKGEVGEIKRAKGISKCVVRGVLRHSDYKQAYYEHTHHRINMTTIRSTNHTITTCNMQKKGLSCWDDKRVWVSENESVPHGSVVSPVPVLMHNCVMPPPPGDVENSFQTDDRFVGRSRGYILHRAVEEESVTQESVVDMSQDERGEAVGFDGDDDEETDESETEEDRMFIDDEDNVAFDVAPLRKRLLSDTDDDDFDVATLAKRCRFS